MVKTTKTKHVRRIVAVLMDRPLSARAGAVWVGRTPAQPQMPCVHQGKGFLGPRESDIPEVNLDRSFKRSITRSMNVGQLASAARAKNPLVSLEDSKQITREGADWLTAAVDPFHDFEITSLKGFPDMATEPTVVVRVNQATTVSAPSTILREGGTWDCHIVISPIDWSGLNTAVPANFSAPPGYTVGGTSYPRGNLTSGAGYVNTNAGNKPPDYYPCSRFDGLLINSVTSDPSQGYNQTYTPVHFPQGDVGIYKGQGIHLDEFMDFEDSDLPVYRILYSGFEVVNTTASLYAQGACTVYEYGHSFGVNCSSGMVTEMTPASYFRCPPNTLDIAKSMPGAQTWEARKGCYNVAKFQTDNPFTSAGGAMFVIQQNKGIGELQSGYLGDTTGNRSGGSFVSPGLGGLAIPNTPNANMPYAAAYMTANHFSRMTTTGAYFTGLSPQTTLTVTWRVGFERLPSANKPFMLTLASPSASYDPDALALYSLICTRLPPGVPQNFNDAGRWFKMITDVAKDVLPHAFPLVGAAQMILTHLGRPQLAAGVSHAAAMAKQAHERHQANKASPRASVPNFGPGKGNAAVRK